jgi:hypothetical protein
MSTVRTEEVTLVLIPKLQPQRTQRMELKYKRGKSEHLALVCQTAEDGTGYVSTTSTHLGKDDIEELIERLIEARGEM